jgi:lipid A 3-O-deacylase
VRASLRALLLVCAPLISGAQTPHTLTLRLDNDAFNYWMMPWDRPDGEYTSGVHITYDGIGPAPWSKRFWPAQSPCVRGAKECTSASAEIGQDIYTPMLRASDPVPGDGSRPNAGWLYLSQSARMLREARSDEITLTLGVTGAPSLARFTQRLAHAAAPEFNRPTDWTHQIGFEPGVMARYQQRRRAVLIPGLFEILPVVTTTVGNVNTSAEVGVQSRGGWHLRHPWLPESSTAATEFSIIAGVSGRAVMRDLFLDGNTFRASPRVGHNPFVGTGELGLQLRHRVFTLAYHAYTSSRAYAAGPAWHPWSSMIGRVTFDR